MRQRLKTGKVVGYKPTAAELTAIGSPPGEVWPALLVGVDSDASATLLVFRPDANLVGKQNVPLGATAGTYGAADPQVTAIRARELRGGLLDPDSRFLDIDVELLNVDARVTALENTSAQRLHAAPVAPVTAADAVDEASAIVLANALRAAYSVHLSDTAAHAVADATNVLTAPVATNAASLYALVNDLKAKLNAGHFTLDAAHYRQMPLQLYAYDDLRFPSNASNPIGAGTSTADFNPDTGLLEFGGTEREYAAFQVQMPHEWAAGTPIEPHIHWIQSAAGGVVWQLEYQILRVGGTVATYPQWTVLAAVENPGIFSYTSGFLHQLTNFPAIPMTGASESTMLNIRLSRQGPEAPDTMSAQAGLLEFDIHYRKDKHGTVDASPSEAGIMPFGIPGAYAVTAVDADSTARAVTLANELKERLNQHFAE